MIDLAEYDFDIIYKQGALNTNADALSRIKLDSDMLKAMIPTEVDVKVITRTMTKDIKRKDQKQRSENTPSTHEPGQLYMWECVSISETRNIRKLKFENTHGNENINSKNDAKMKKIVSQIKFKNNTVLVEFGDNPRLNLELTLEKLIQFARRNKIRELALANNDEIFNYESKENLMKIYNNMHQDKNKELIIIMYTPPIRITDKKKQIDIIKEFHDTPLIGGHSGIKRTLNKIKQRYCWKNLSKMVKEYVNKCESCSKNKQIRKTKEKLELTETPNTSFHTLSMDTVGPVRQSKYFRYILTIQCDLTKYVIAVPVENKEAGTIARALVENVILKFGLFKRIKTDLGTEFINKTFNNICDILEIQHDTSTPYHHETLGSIERNHRTLNEYLLSFCQEQEWDEWLQYYTFCYNITPHADTGMSPHELVFGKIAILPNAITQEEPQPIYNINDYAYELKWRLQQAHRIAQKLLELAKNKRKQTYDTQARPIDIKPNDKVWLRVGTRKKHESPYEGPYVVLETNRVNAKIKLGNKVKEVHKNRLKKMKHLS